MTSSASSCAWCGAPASNIMGSTLPLIRRLNEHGVDFIVIGGVAAVAHGSALITNDLDICASLDHPNAVKIITALADLHPRFRMRPDLPIVTVDSPNLRGLKNLYLKTDEGQLDILGEVTGIGDFAALAPAAVRMDLGGVICRV